MASAEEVARLLPETLPEDFNEWDGEGSQAPAPNGSDEWDSAYGHSQAQKPVAQSDYLDEILQSFESKSRVWRSDSSAAFVKPPVFVKPQDEFERWQKEAAAPTHEKPGESEAARSTNDTAKPYEVSAEGKAAVTQALNGQHDQWPELSEPVFAKPQKLTIEMAEGPTRHHAEKPVSSETKSEAKAAPNFAETAAADEIDDSVEFASKSMFAAGLETGHKAGNALLGIFSRRNVEDEEEQKSPMNKRLIVIGAGAVSILLPLVLMVTLGHHGAKAAAKPVIQPVPPASDIQPSTNETEPTASEPAIQEMKPEAAKKQQPTESQPVEEKADATAEQPVTEAQQEMMSDQLEAPRTIPRDAKKLVAENGPPPESLGMAGTEGLAGSAASGSIFNGHGPATVKAVRAQPLAVSSGVANGMLIRRTPPIYPAIAKAAREGGTVELHAVISKNGTIKDLQVINGPPMLRQAAVDAVRSWRYRPYTLNNEPVEVETTVSVVFSLGN